MTTTRPPPSAISDDDDTPTPALTNGTVSHRRGSSYSPDLEEVSYDDESRYRTYVAPGPHVTRITKKPYRCLFVTSSSTFSVSYSQESSSPTHDTFR